MREVIWIIGASTGIGKQLAMLYARAGHHIIVSARNGQLLQEFQPFGATIIPLDVLNYKAIEAAFDQVMNEFQTIERIVYLPAFYNPDSFDTLTTQVVDQTIDTNIKAPLYFIIGGRKYFQSGRVKQLALTSSLVAIQALVNDQPYSATKAALTHIGISLYNEWGDTLDIKIIAPGFVATPMTDKNTFKMPFLLTAEQAAKIIQTGLTSKKLLLEFPFPTRFLMKLASFLPHNWIKNLLHLL